MTSQQTAMITLEIPMTASIPLYPRYLLIWLHIKLDVRSIGPVKSGIDVR